MFLFITDNYTQDVFDYLEDISFSETPFTDFLWLHS